MRGITAETPEEYLAAIPSEQGDALRALRAQILALLPEAEQRISYGIIVFRHGKRGLLGISCAQAHCSLHLMSPPLAKALAGRLPDGKISGATVRFTPEHPLSDESVRMIVEGRLAEA